MSRFFCDYESTRLRKDRLLVHYGLMYADTDDPEALRGERPYLDVLARIHRLLDPEIYLEIGVRNGNSLRLARRKGIGIDPAPQLTQQLGADVAICSMTSDRFFEELADTQITRPLDLAFIDGMHLFEFALRDFINVERYSDATSVVVFDDIFPNHPLQARRQRETGAWTGDVWKIVYCLASLRPDLVLIPIDAHPAGLLVVANLDPENRRLHHDYETIVDRFCGRNAAIDPPAEIMNRTIAPATPQSNLDALMLLLKGHRLSQDPADRIRDSIAEWRGGQFSTRDEHNDAATAALNRHH